MIENNNEKIICNFNFHNVGQGLFYTGQIGDFNFVYDCGGKRKYIDKAVEDYKNSLNGKPIDMLVISHFHEDHTRGLNKLLTQKVKNIVLPYYSPIERLYFSLKKISSDDWYYSFLSDPVSYIREIGDVNNFYFISGKSGNIKEEIPEDRRNRDKGEENIDLDELEDNNHLFDIIEENEKGWNRNVFSKNPSKSISLKDLWEFKFFNQELSDDVIHKLKNCVNEVLGSNDLDEIKKGITDYQIRRKLKKCYKKTGLSLNETSLALWHRCIQKKCLCNYMPLHSCRSSFLLTGDIDLSTNSRYERFKKHYKNFYQNRSIIQVQHHGSKHNWNKKLLYEFNNYNTYIISSGVSNRYFHPHKKVIEDLLDYNNHNNHIKLCNETEDIHFWGRCFK